METNNYKLKPFPGLLKLILLSIVTLGIYAIVIYSRASESINTVASPHDGKKTMHYCLLGFLIAPITLCIGALVWQHRISNRIGSELTRRGLGYEFSAKTFWLWGVLGAFIIVGPFIYTHRFLKSMNLLVDDYNAKGN